MFLPLVILGQQLKCCESKKEVKLYLSGKWKIKNSDSKTIYHFWFEKGQGNLTEIEQVKNENEYIIVDDHTFVDIIECKQVFKLKFTHLHSNYTSELKYLSSNRMILITDKIEIEYIKESE